MKYDVQLSQDAESDFDNIADYTLENWGAVQLLSYMAELKKTVYSLETKPEKKGISRADLKEGLRSIPHQNHYHIFYRVRGETVEIIRILHQSMNWQRFFHEG